MYIHIAYVLLRMTAIERNLRTMDLIVGVRVVVASNFGRLH